MKQKISILVDDRTVELIEESINEGRFRNKSHIVEYSINKLLKESKNE